MLVHTVGGIEDFGGETHSGDMAVNPPVQGTGLPVPFSNEFFVLSRDKVEVEVDKLAE